MERLCGEFAEEFKEFGGDFFRRAHRRDAHRDEGVEEKCGGKNSWGERHDDLFRRSFFAAAHAE